MRDEEKLAMLGDMTGETSESILSAYLNIAASKILRRAFPFGTDATAVPACYEINQIEIAAYLINKRGAEGETAHSENGVSRSYEGGDVPTSLMREIVPFAATM